MFQSRLLPMQRSSLTTKIITITPWLLFLVVFLAALLMPQLALAQDDALEQVASASGLPTTNLIVIIGNIIRIFLSLLGIILVVLILYAGFLWMTAAGNPDQVQKAKDIIKRAIVGLIIIVSAFAIVSFIITRLTGSFWGGGSGGPGGPGGPTPGINPGRWGLGAGPIQSVLPSPGENDVPINTIIAVTFKEPVDPDSFSMANIDICMVDIATSNCVTGDDQFRSANYEDSTIDTNDNLTFVITPEQYLGAEDKLNRLFRVNLGSGILSAETGQSIFANTRGLEQRYDWEFTTNGELDLDPPEVINVSAVYPYPDVINGGADGYSESAAATPTKFSVFNTNFGSYSSALNYQREASYTQPSAVTGNTPSAQISGVYGGLIGNNSDVSVYIESRESGNYLVVNWPDGMEDIERIYNSGDPINIGPYGLSFTVNGTPQPGNEWKFTVTAAVNGDKLQILENGGLLAEYVFEGNSPGGVISGFNQVVKDSGVLEIIQGSTDSYQTVETGSRSARYDIRFIHNGEVVNNNVIEKTSGTDRSSVRSVNGIRDPYRNSIFQITFNEPINPLSLKKENIIVDYITSSEVVVPVGAFEISQSNNYRTIELIPTQNCDTKNSCGQEMYCWPVEGSDDGLPSSTHYVVRFQAASLVTADDSRCSIWGGANASDTSNRCVKTIGGKQVFYPAAQDGLDGLVDRANNSLNGSFDTYTDNDGREVGLAQGRSIALDTDSGVDGRSGRQAYYLNSNVVCENNSIGNICLSSGSKVVSYQPSVPVFNISGFGDDFRWEFYLSSEIDTQAPLITSLSPGANVEIRNLNQPIAIVFDRLMRSSSLKPGWNYGNTAKSKSERYMVLDTVTLNQTPVGYWIDKINADIDSDGWADRTEAEINHSRFSRQVLYSPLVGSGVQSITQNCFIPAGGPKNAAESGNCSYVGDSTSGCVTDSSLENSQVKIPNPASYAAMACDQIVGTDVCTANEVCMVSYFNNNNADSYRAGSYVISQDYPTIDIGNGLPVVSGACCFGSCVPKTDLKSCEALGGQKSGSRDENTCQSNNDLSGEWVISSDLIDKTIEGCCLGDLSSIN